MYKNSLLISFIVLLAVFSGCNKKELEELREKNKELSKTIDEKNAKIQQLENQYNKIEKNLQLIVLEKAGDTVKLQKIDDNKIMKRLETVREKMVENKNKAKSTETKFSNLRYQARKYERKAEKKENQLEKHKDSIKSVKEELLTKKEHIEEMTSKLEDKDSTISKLTEQKEAYKDSLTDKSKELNKAYIAVKPKKQLKKESIIKKKGGFLGFIGQVKVLNPEYDESNFETLNTKEKRSIAIDTKLRKIEIVTPHPENSYTLEKANENKTLLKIQNKDKFWRAGKHLVIAY